MIIGTSKFIWDMGGLLMNNTASPPSNQPKGSNCRTGVAFKRRTFAVVERTPARPNVGFYPSSNEFGIIFVPSTNVLRRQLMGWRS